MHAVAQAQIAKDFGETREDLGMKERECDALRSNVGELEDESECVMHLRLMTRK